MTTTTAPASKSAAVRRAGIELQAIPADIDRARECLDHGFPIKAAEWIAAANRRANAVLELLDGIFTATANERRAAAIEFRAESMRLGQERIAAIEAIESADAEVPAAPAETIAHDSHFGMETPAIDGRPVMQGHADYCAAHGHMKWTRDGVVDAMCPRCGEIVAPVESVTTADEHRAAAVEHDRKSAESFDRCDTDGALTQWGHDMLAQEHRLAARIAENGGTWTFPALFDLDGNLVAAKNIKTPYGYAWGILESDDPSSRVVRWFNESEARTAAVRNRNNARKGYTVGRVKAPARAELKGGNIMSVTAVPVRLDDGFSRDVEIVSTVDTDD